MPTLNSRLISEFVGTFVLVFTVGSNVLGKTQGFAVASIAFSLMIMIYALGNVSGAHFNPAVTASILVAEAGESAKPKDKRLAVSDGVAYMLAQILGGVSAGFASFRLFNDAVNLQPGLGYGAKSAGLVEFAYTMFLCLTVLCVAHRENNANSYYGMAIAGTVIAGGYAAGSVSGGAFNPAVAFGLDVPSAGLGFGWSFAYLGFELAGAVAAALVYKMVYPSCDEKSSDNGALVSEFLGTFFLTLTVGLNVVEGSPAPAFSIAFALISAIYAFGGSSGAHLNPAVTFGLILNGSIETAKAAKYIAAQLVGGAAAALYYVAVTDRAFPLMPGSKFGWTAATTAEVIFTAVLVLTVLATAVPDSFKSVMNTWYGLAIGGCVVAGGFAAGPISGGCLNPAVAVGIDVANAVKGGFFGNSLAYSAMELTGAAAAFGLYQATYAAADKAKKN
jgi:aquaporin Z